MQFGHLTALMLIADLQKGHSFVFGAAGAGALLNLLIILTSINTAQAVIKKLMVLFIKEPKFKITAPAF